MGLLDDWRTRMGPDSDRQLQCRDRESRLFTKDVDAGVLRHDARVLSQGDREDWRTRLPLRAGSRILGTEGRRVMINDRAAADGDEAVAAHRHPSQPAR